MGNQKSVVNADLKKATVTLTDFSGRSGWMGEPSRYMLAYVGVTFNDVRIELADWPALKSDTTRFPFGFLPTLEVDGHILCETQAILRYLGRLCGLAGTNEWEAAQIDQYNEEVKGTINLFSSLRGIAESEKPKYFNETFLPALHKFLAQYQGFLDKAGNTFFVGNKLSYVDINLAASIVEWKLREPQAGWEKYPRLTSDFVNRVRSIPSIKKSLEDRK